MCWSQLKHCNLRYFFHLKTFNIQVLVRDTNIGMLNTKTGSRIDQSLASRPHKAKAYNISVVENLCYSRFWIINDLIYWQNCALCVSGSLRKPVNIILINKLTKPTKHWFQERYMRKYLTNISDMYVCLWDFLCLQLLAFISHRSGSLRKCHETVWGVLSHLLVSTYVVCERLSVMHEPAGVVEILVQILRNTPYSEAPPKIQI